MKRSVLCIAAMVGLASSPSFAGATHVVSVGAGGVTNDPFVRVPFVAIGYESRPEERVSIGANLHYSPSLGDTNWKPITKQLIEENHVSPDISNINYAGRLALTVFPVQHREPTFMTKVGFATSVGMVHTSESFESLDSYEGPRAVSTSKQFHPCLGFAITAEVWRDNGFGIRMRRDRMVHIETVNATQLEMKSNAMFMIDLMRRF
jgi:hypothetical protein